MYGDVVMGVAHEKFENAFALLRQRYEANADTDVPEAGMRELCDEYLSLIKKHTGQPFPQDPYEQLERAIEAVIAGWNTPRAVRYREVECIHDLIGTAVNVQAMVYGTWERIQDLALALREIPRLVRTSLWRVPRQFAGRRCRCWNSNATADQGDVQVESVGVSPMLTSKRRSSGTHGRPGY